MPSRLLDRDKESEEPWKQRCPDFRNLKEGIITKDRVSCIDLIGGAHAGFVWHMIGSPQLFDGLRWHGFREAQTAPSVSGGAHLRHHRLL